jgi:hypothetical protein
MLDTPVEFFQPGLFMNARKKTQAGFSSPWLVPPSRYASIGCPRRRTRAGRGFICVAHGLKLVRKRKDTDLLSRWRCPVKSDN